jgi:hypothetical protein
VVAAGSRGARFRPGELKQAELSHSATPLSRQFWRQFCHASFDAHSKAAEDGGLSGGELAFGRQFCASFNGVLLKLAFMSHALQQ